MHRLKIFYDNYLFVKENNSNSDGGATLALNLFADLHIDEFFRGDTSAPQEPKALKTAAAETIPHRVQTNLAQSPSPSPKDNVDWEKS